MFCTSCGKQLEEKSKYCKYCGAKIVTQEIKEETSEVHPVHETNDVHETDELEKVRESNEVLESKEEHKSKEAPEIGKPQEPEEAHKVEQSMESNESNEFQDREEAQNEEDVQKNNTSHRKRRIVYSSVLIFILMIIFGGAFLGYQNYLKKKAELVVALFDAGDYDMSRETYDEYCAGRKGLMNTVNQELTYRMEEAKEEYINGIVDYNTARGKLEAIVHLGGDVLHGEAVAAIGWIENIQLSRDNYTYGQEYMKAEEYEKAIEAFSMVVEEDSENFKKAAQEINRAQQKLKEVQEKQEEEARINELRETILQRAEAFTKTYEYKDAVETMNQGLEAIPGDEKLLTMLEYYQELYNMTEHIQEIKENTYEYVYQEEELDILTVHITVPQIKGDLESYQKINEVFQTLQDNYIESCAKMAEEVREYAKDEFFYTHSLDMGYSVTYNKNGILCILVEGYEYLGGAHGSPYRITYVFNIASGEPMVLEELITLDESEFLHYAAAAFEDLIGQNPEEYWEDAIDTIYDTEGDQILYYLTEEGLVVYYYPYELSDYARGFVEALIPFDGHEELFGFLG